MVKPAKAAPGTPWIWRPEFFEAVNQADLAPVNAGFPLCYIDLKNNFGCPSSLDLMDRFNDHAAAQIPILSVCGDADTAVPYLENSSIVKERYRALGGKMKVILKPGADHHPHSLENPALIVKAANSH